jgi:hypothetical protein
MTGKAKSICHWSFDIFHLSFRLVEGLAALAKLETKLLQS